MSRPRKPAKPPKDAITLTLKPADRERLDAYKAEIQIDADAPAVVSLMRKGLDAQEAAR